MRPPKQCGNTHLLEAERCIKRQSRLVCCGRLDCDQADLVGTSAADDLADEETPIAFAALFWDDFQIDQTKAILSVLAVKAAHVPGGRPRQLVAARPGQELH